MDNPAANLLKIFERWRETLPDKPLTASRSIRTANQDAATDHVTAMRLIEQIRQSLDHLDSEVTDVSVFREASVKWVHLVIAYPHGWSGAGATVLLSNEARLDMLRALVIVLATQPARINVDALAELGGFLDDIQKLLGEDEGLDDALRAYVAHLVAEVRRALGIYQSTGDFDGQEATKNLWVALLAAQAQSNGNRETWAQFASKLKAPITSGLIVGLPMLAIEAAKLAAGG